MFDHYFSGQVSLWYETSMPRLRAALGTTTKHLWEWRSMAYLGLTVMLVYAFQEARTPVTMITPFELSKSDPRFNGKVVADAVRDGLKTILNEIDQEKDDVGLSSSETGLPDLRNILIPKYWHVQTPPRFTVEVKGISYERVVSLFRAVMRTETPRLGLWLDSTHLTAAQTVDAILRAATPIPVQTHE